MRARRRNIPRSSPGPVTHALPDLLERNLEVRNRAGDEPMYLASSSTVSQGNSWCKPCEMR